MIVLRALLATVLVAGVLSERFARQALSRDDSDTFQVLPRRALVKPGGRITLKGNAGVPLQRCLFYLPDSRSKWPIDFSLGPASESTDRYEYFGSGLEFGECGMRMKKVADDDDGLIQCVILAAGSEDWEKSATTLRVTPIREIDLPVFQMEPNRNLINLARGDDLTIECNADRPITLCHIYLPGPVFLNMDKGLNSTATSKHRYHGNGLDKGECGATLTGVDEKLTGFVVCKVGTWPESLDGKWETDSFQVITKEFITTPISDPSTAPLNTTRNATECLPLVSKSVDIKCFFGGKPTDCSKPQKIRAIANMKCKPGYAVPSRINYNKITCLKGGVWDPRPLTCQPDCGKRITNEGVPFISNALNSMIGEFPWHVGIYQQSKGELVQACGGSLLTPSVVVSAAHCFWNENEQKKMDHSLYRVAAGKHARAWDFSTAWVQKREVLEIIVPKGYHGRGTNFKSDIALVRLSSPLEITSVVNLVCVDWNHDFDKKHLTLGSEGIVTGWGFTETGSQSDVLQYIGLPYRPREVCLKTLRIDLQPLLTEDKFCAGFVNESKSVCRGDSGGGLVFLEPRTNKYYLRGLVSIAFMADRDGICNIQDYTGFTQFDEYQDWALDNLNYDYGKHSTPEPSTTTPIPTIKPRPGRPTPKPSRPTSSPDWPKPTPSSPTSRPGWPVYRPRPTYRPQLRPTPSRPIPTDYDIIVFPTY